MAILGPSRPFLAIFRPFLRKISDRNLLNQFVWCQASPDTTLEYPQRVLCWNLKMAILGPSRPFSGHFSAILTKDWLSNFIKSLCMMSGIFRHSFRVPTKGTLLKLQKWPFWAQIGHFQAIFRPFWLKIGDQILLNHFVWCQTFPDTSLEYPQRVLCWNLENGHFGPY